ncbi:MAG: Sua5/YciO/YrdC/YwlC family protein, partial [Candidatus Thalassarchaeaceae archaeon]|nr:Sua5/YciO/YrdC/YwlC family protein [Candidatus Thalassarchaeaceae archaeon]
MNDDGFLLEMCSGRAAWTVIPENISSINLESVTAKIEAEGWKCTLRNRLCCTFSGEADVTLYPSGKLLVKSGERDVAQRIATRHIQVWLANESSEEFEIPDAIIERVKRGLPIVYPTSTLPALGCIPEVNALDLLFTIKNRNETKVVSLGVATLEQANQLVNIPEEATEILDAFPPGSLTLILPAHEMLDSRLGGSNVAIRVLSDPR